MSETNKVYVCPDNNNNLAETMALMNSNNNWNNNPFLYLIWLAFFGGNGFGWNKNQNNEDLSRQVQTLLTSISDNHNNDLAMQAIQGNSKALSDLAGNLNIGVATLGNAISSIKGAIDLVGANNGTNTQSVINSVLLGNKDLVQQIATCCCENKQLVTTMGYEGQLRDLANTAAIDSKLDQLSNSMQNGFTNSIYTTLTQTSQLSRDLQALTQTIIDKISNMESNAQQERINELTALLTAANARAERAAELQPIIQQLNQIKSSQPSTVAVQYPQLSVFPSYLNSAALSGFYNTNFWG